MHKYKNILWRKPRALSQNNPSNQTKKVNISYASKTVSLLSSQQSKSIYTEKIDINRGILQYCTLKHTLIKIQYRSVSVSV